MQTHQTEGCCCLKWGLCEDVQQRDQTGALFLPLRAPGFLSSLVSYFYPLFFHPSHHTDDLSHLLSLGNSSSPYHSAPALFWFSPQCSFFPPPVPTLPFTSSPPPPPSHPPPFLLHYFHRSFFHSFSLLLSPLSTNTFLPPSLPHTLSLLVLWKLSPLWGCHAEDLSPSAPAVPLKVT